MSKKWVQLASALFQATDTGKVEWSLIEDGKTLSAEFAENSIRIREAGSSQQYLFEISDLSGRVIDKFTDDDLIALGYDLAYTKSSEMFNSVKRKVSGADDALENIISEIEGRKN
jgi:hypothetical protein